MSEERKRKKEEKRLEKEQRKLEKIEAKKKKKENKKTKKKETNNQPTMNIFKAMTEKIVGMGYTYSIFSLLRTFAFFTFAIIVLSYFHELQPVYIAILVLSVIFLLPFSIYAQYKYLYEQKRFQELCIYLKFMKINFKQYKKILIALKETLDNFSEEDRIYPYIKQAILDIESGIPYREALDKIEKPFKNSYITKLHAYMILGETEGGGAVFEALDGIDYENWRTDTYVFQTQKFKQQNQNGFFTIFGLSISLAVVYIFKDILAKDGVGDMMGNIFSTPLFQISTFVYILFDLISFILVKTMITGKWVREDE